MNWMLYAVIAAVALAAADVFIKLAAGKLPNSLGTLLYGAVAFSVGLSWVVADRVRGNVEPVTAAGIVYALGVGVSFSAVTVALYAAFRAGADLSLMSPVVRLSGVIVASLCGLLIWSEPVTPRYAAGLLLTVAGLYLIVSR